MKKFLSTFAGIAATFAASAIAAPSTPHTMNPAMELVSVVSKSLTASDSKNDQFNFVLKKSADTGLMMAAHGSHSSHASHASHASHFSRR